MIRVRRIDFEETKISKIKVFKDTGTTLYFRVLNEEDNSDDYSVVPGEEGYEAIKDLFLERSIDLYDDADESPSIAFCQRQRIGIENDLKLLGYSVHQILGCWVAVKLA
jgi:hypothetical protein